MKPSAALVWGSATGMVTIVSCCSLVGVSIMPLISGPSYKIFITLFTGLAVGSLLGSAVFSLIPQAFGLHLSGDKSYLWLSLVIFFGIYLFYCSERLMRIYFDRKAKRKTRQQENLQLKRNKSSASLSANDQDSNPNANAIEGGDKGAGDALPNASGIQTNTNTDNNQQATQSATIQAEPMTEINLNKDQEDDLDDETQINSLHGVQHHHHHHHHHHHALNPQEIVTKALKIEKAEREEHRNQLPVRRAEIAPVAWMIIIGDGLHNFIDGLSIGAAFSESLALGFTTSIAVIFEEFPHELGDFAVLISAGMTVRQALGFNFLSACTCYIGMIFGILLGDLTQSASFIFALAGGMFLYISLVDMMGELSAMLEESKQSTRECLRLLTLQNLGILSGIIIIFILSLVTNG